MDHNLLQLNHIFPLCPPGHPHLHILCSDGVFCRTGVFQVAPKFNLKALEQLFRHKVLRRLLARGRITREMIRMMGGWRHSGFNVYCGPRILPREKRALENLAAYLIRSSFSQQRMEYRPVEAKVTYCSKDGKEKKSYDAPEWLAAMGSHVPERGQSLCATTACMRIPPGVGSENAKLTIRFRPSWNRIYVQGKSRGTGPG